MGREKNGIVEITTKITFLLKLCVSYFFKEIKLNFFIYNITFNNLIA